MGSNPAGPHHGGVDPVKIALRDALKIYTWQHLGKHPQSWFTAVELARVIRDRYICDPRPPSVSAYRYGRSNVIMSVLRELERMGDVISQPSPHRKGTTLWRIAGSG
jgi:hypothetical protein